MRSSASMHLLDVIVARLVFLTGKIPCPLVGLLRNPANVISSRQVQSRHASLTSLMTTDATDHLPPHPPFMRLAEHLTMLRAWCKHCLPGR